mgnify:CR=1 FL=1
MGNKERPRLHKRVKNYISQLDAPYELVRKKDHWFIRIPGGLRDVCLASAGSKRSIDTQPDATIKKIEASVEQAKKVNDGHSNTRLRDVLRR